MFDDKSVTFHGTPCSRFAGCAISKVFSKRNLEFESTGFSAGRIVKKSVQAVPNYMINDYLSSVRVVTDHTGNVLERNDYYGFGSRIDCVSEGDNRYRFSGKESLSGFGIDYMDFGARLYDPVICRWLSQDPLAFSTPSVSPYSYCAGDPVNFVDPDGMLADEYDKNGKKISEKGGDTIDFYHVEETNENGEVHKLIKVVDRETGEFNYINDDNLLQHSLVRLDNVDWKTITKEFLMQMGPTNSLFINTDDSSPAPFGSLMSENSIYHKELVRVSHSSSDIKGRFPITYKVFNPFRAGKDMWTQMIGRANVSWYKLGDKFLYILQDSKSNQSLFLHLPFIPQKENLSHGFGFRTTYQTYIWIETN